MESRIYNAKRNIITGFGGRVASIFFPFLTRSCIIYIFGVTYLGLNSLFASILQVLSLAELGFGEAMVFSMYEPLSSHNAEKVCSILNLYKNIYRVIGFIVFLAGLCFMPFLDKLILGGYPKNINVVLLYIINLINTVISYFMFAYKRSLLSAMQRLSVCNNVGIVIQILTSLVQLIMLLVFKNYYFYAAAVPVFTVLSNIIIHYKSKKICPQYFAAGKLEKGEIVSICKRVGGLFIYKLCSNLRSSFDSIIISAFLGLAVLGKYENYYFILLAVMSFFAIIYSGVTAGVGNSIVTETIEKNYKDFMTFFFMYEWLVCFCMVCLFCLYQSFIYLWVGKENMFGMDIVILLCIYFFVLKTGDLCYIYRQAAGIWWSDKLRPAIEAVLNLVLNLLFVKKFGVAGVLLATIATMLGINLFWGTAVLFKTYFKRSMKAYIIRMFIYAATACVCVIVTYGVCGFITGDNVFAFIGKMAVCAVVPNLIMTIAYFKFPEFSNMKKICISLFMKGEEKL